MARDHVWMLRAEVRGQAIDDVHRPMLPASAADRNGEVAAIVTLLVRNARFDEACNLVDEPLDIRV